MGDNNYPYVYSKLFSNLGIISNSKVKLTYDGSMITVFNNDIEIDQVKKTYNAFRIGFQFQGNSSLSYNLLTICKR